MNNIDKNNNLLNSSLETGAIDNSDISSTAHNIIYIHGYISSPNSLKAQQTKHYLAQHYPEIKYFCPQLPASPAKAIQILVELIKSKPQQKWLLIGSSLGGYYASYLAEKMSLLNVLINPVVEPFKLFKNFTGIQKNQYTAEEFIVDDKYMEELRDLNCPEITKKSYLVMVQTGDEVLNYQHAVSKYQSCELIIQQGGDHGFIDFPKMLPKICQFWQLPSVN